MKNNKSKQEYDQDFYTTSEQLGIKKISPKLIRQIEGHENSSDEEIESIIESLYQLSLIAYSSWQEKELRFKDKIHPTLLNQ